MPKVAPGGESSTAARAVWDDDNRQDEALRLDMTWPELRSAIVQRLTEEQRLLIILWYVERMSVQEIAMVLEMTTTQVIQHHDGIVQSLHQVVSEAA